MPTGLELPSFSLVLQELEATLARFANIIEGPRALSPGNAHLVSGAQRDSLSLWRVVSKKAPVFVRRPDLFPSSSVWRMTPALSLAVTSGSVFHQLGKQTVIVRGSRASFCTAVGFYKNAAVLAAIPELIETVRLECPRRRPMRDGAVGGSQSSSNANARLLTQTGQIDWIKGMGPASVGLVAKLLTLAKVRGSAERPWEA